MRLSDRSRSRALARLLAAVLSLVPPSALAATLTVNSSADALIPSDGECTLAIINANTDSDTTQGDWMRWQRF